MNIIEFLKQVYPNQEDLDQVLENLYIPVRWPESQMLMERKDFLKNCHLINDTTGYQQFGDSAYMVNLKWYLENK